MTECDSRCRKTGSALSRNTGSVLSQKKPCSEKTGATEGAADENATVAVAQCEEYLKKIFSGNATVGVALFEGICNPMERQKGRNTLHFIVPIMGLHPYTTKKVVKGACRAQYIRKILSRRS